MDPKNKKSWVADLSRRSIADKFFNGAIVPENAYKHIKFQIRRYIIFGDMEGSQNKKWGC